MKIKGNKQKKTKKDCKIKIYNLKTKIKNCAQFSILYYAFEAFNFFAKLDFFLAKKLNAANA